VVSQQHADITDTVHLGTLPWQPFFGFLYMGCTLAHLANTTEPTMCGSDAALYQITLTTCLFLSEWFLS